MSEAGQSLLDERIKMQAMIRDRYPQAIDQEFVSAMGPMQIVKLVDKLSKYTPAIKQAIREIPTLIGSVSQAVKPSVNRITERLPGRFLSAMSATDQPVDDHED